MPDRTLNSSKLPDFAMRASRRLVALCAVVIVGACSEKLDSGAACPSLCPDQNIPLVDSVLTGVALDTTLVGLPPTGTEPRLLLANRGDTLETRIVARFDTLPKTYIGLAGDTVAITTVDSARVRLRFDVGGSRLPANFTVSVYDVDTTANDTSRTVVLSLFRPDRLLGTRDFARTDVLDSLLIYLDNAKLSPKIAGGARVRLGFKVTSTESIEISGLGSEAAVPPQLTFRVSADTTIQPLRFVTLSGTPSDLPAFAASLRDYTIVVKGTPAPPATTLAVGGLPGHRIYLRFNLPTDIVDSFTVVRATLLLTRQPVRDFGQQDTVKISPQFVTAAAAVTDPGKAALLLLPPGSLGLDTLNLVPADSGEVSIEMVSVLRRWRLHPATEVPRALVLRSLLEGAQGGEVRFFSSEAPAAVRPRLRLTYIPKVQFGLP